MGGVTGRIVGLEVTSAARDRVLRRVGIAYLWSLLAGSLVAIAGFLAAGESHAAAVRAALVPSVLGLQALLLAALTPWVVFRLHGEDLSGGMVPATGCVAVAPWQTLLGKLIAPALYLLVLLGLSLPVLSLTRLLGATTYGGMAVGLSETLLFLLALVLVVTLLRLLWQNWAAAWVCSYAALGVLAFAWYRTRSALSGEAAVVLLLLAAMLLASLLFAYGARRCVYMTG